MASAGEKYGPYTCVSRIGEGGMAETYLALQSGPHGFEQRVCIKLIREDCKALPKFVDAFFKEATIAASLRHSNIVGVIDASQQEGYMVLELVDGVDLRSLVQATPGSRLAPDLVTQVALELVKALDFAHNRRLHGKPDGVVHRDIKPSNVLISYAGEVKLADFGIARAIRSSEDSDGAVRGTVSYMSPEQVRGQPLDARSDLFSLGILLYEVLAGRRPFGGRHDTDTMERICEGEYTKLAEVAPEVPAGLAGVIEQLLRTDPEKCYATARELGDDLDRFAPPPSTYRRLGTLAREARPPETLMPTDETGIPVITRPVALLAEQPDPSPPSIGHEDTAHVSEVEPVVAGPRQKTGTAEPREPSTGSVISSTLPKNRLPLYAGLAVFVASALVAAFAYRAAPGPVSDSAGGTEPSNAPSPAPPAVETEPDKPSTPPPAIVYPIESSESEPPGAGEETETAPSDKPVARTDRPARKARARLRVGVFPWGKVWIDGKERGTSPVEIDVSAGRHTIAGGREKPTKKKTVTLKPGTRKEVVINL